MEPERAWSKSLEARSRASGGRVVGFVGGGIVVGFEVVVEAVVVLGCAGVEVDGGFAVVSVRSL